MDAQWYGLTGEPISLVEAMRLPDDERRIVARSTRFRHGEATQISTVFLVLNHEWRQHMPPLLWETMIFGGSHDGELWRYTSREAALRGHRLVLRMLRDDKRAADELRRKRTINRLRQASERELWARISGWAGHAARRTATL